MAEMERPGTVDLGLREIRRIRGAIESAVLETAEAGGSMDDEVGSYLRLVSAARVASDESSRLLQESVHQAKRAGHSWATIGDVLNVSRQAAQQRFGPREATPVEGAGSDRVIRGVNAFNEMQLLAAEGAAGNHLVSFGWACLVVRPSNRRWEHKRVASLFTLQVRAEMTEEGWTYVGMWFPFQYFKRPLDDD